MYVEPGPYYISSVSFATGKPVSRFLGAGQGPEEAIVVLPLGSPPPVVSYDIFWCFRRPPWHILRSHAQWSIVRLPNNNYIFNLYGRFAEVVDGSLKLTRPSFPPFDWTILQGAPSPPPIGKDSYGWVSGPLQIIKYHRIDDFIEELLPQINNRRRVGSLEVLKVTNQLKFRLVFYISQHYIISLWEIRSQLGMSHPQSLLSLL